MATYKARVLDETYRRRLRPRTHYSLGRLPAWLAAASRAPRLANAALSSRLPAAAGRSLAGVDARRALPLLAAETFRSWARGRPAGSGTPLVLLADTFTNYIPRTPARRPWRSSRPPATASRCRRRGCAAG
ncbi:MAG: hypothetical protein ACR2KL_08540 [Nocardioidaceae bacterium]